MPNDFYNHGSYPATGSQGASSSMRAELDAITAGFDKLAPLSGNAGKFLIVNAGGTGQDVSSALSESGGNLTITGSTSMAALTLSGVLLIAAGSALLPSLAVAGDTDSGMYSGGANLLRFGTGGVSKLQINSTPGLYVGDASADVAASSVGLYVRPRLVSAGATQYGLFENTRLSIGCTGTGHGVYSLMRFEDGVYTTTNVFSFRAANPAAGVGQIIDNVVGLYIDDLTAGGATNRGLRLTLSAAANKHNVYADGTAQNYFRGNVGIGASKTAPASALEVDGSVVVDNGTLSVNTTTSGGGGLITSTQDGVTGTRLVLFHDSASPAANDLIGELRFNGRDSVATPTTYGQIYSRIISTTNGAEEGALEFYTINGGSPAIALELRDGSAILSNTAVVDQYEAGFRGAPTVLRNATAAFGLVDAGKTVYKGNTTAYTWTINPDSTTDFPLGTVISLLHDSTAGDITIARGVGVALINGTTDANQTITAGTRASIQKISANRWRFN